MVWEWENKQDTNDQQRNPTHQSVSKPGELSGGDRTLLETLLLFYCLDRLMRQQLYGAGHEEQAMTYKMSPWDTL